MTKRMHTIVIKTYDVYEFLCHMRRVPGVIQSYEFAGADEHGDQRFEIITKPGVDLSTLMDFMSDFQTLSDLYND